MVLGEGVKELPAPSWASTGSCEKVPSLATLNMPPRVSGRKAHDTPPSWSSVGFGIRPERQPEPNFHGPVHAYLPQVPSAFIERILAHPSRPNSNWWLWACTTPDLLPLSKLHCGALQPEVARVGLARELAHVAQVRMTGGECPMGYLH